MEHVDAAIVLMGSDLTVPLARMLMGIPQQVGPKRVAGGILKHERAARTAR